MPTTPLTKTGPAMNRDSRYTGQAARWRGVQPVEPLDELASVVNGTFVLVVEVADGQYRRRCFLSARAAERAARNATEAGHDAKVYLAELRPLWQLVAGE